MGNRRVPVLCDEEVEDEEEEGCGAGALVVVDGQQMYGYGI